MEIYIFDEVTKEYLSKREAQANPKRPGEYLTPPSSTTIEPLERKKGFAIVFDGEAWEYVPDYRGSEVLNAETGDITFIKYLGDIKQGEILLTEETKLGYLSGKYILKDGELVLNPDYEKEQIEKLTVTKRVFALALQQAGITYAQLKELIATNDQAQLEWDLCVELQRSNPLLDVMGAQLGITPEQLDEIFVKANEVA